MGHASNDDFIWYKAKYDTESSSRRAENRMIKENRSDNMEINSTYITEPDEIACTTSSKNSMNTIVMERIHGIFQDIWRQRENVTSDSINVQACKEGIDILLYSYINSILLKYL